MDNLKINNIQEEIIEEFSVFSEWMEKYEYIIDLGKELSPMNEETKSEENLVKGCQSRVWVNAIFKDGLVSYEADSDAIITKGLIALLLRVYNRQSPDEILKHEPYFIEKIGLKEHLSPTRSNGLVNMVKKIKLYALAYKAKANTI